jgi:hypothetical protein
LVALFRVFFEARVDIDGAISGCLSFHLRSIMVTRFIPMLESGRNGGQTGVS